MPDRPNNNPLGLSDALPLELTAEERKDVEEAEALVRSAIELTETTTFEEALEVIRRWKRHAERRAVC